MALVLLSIAGLVILVLLAIGQVPIRYNIRNLTVRWRTTLMTALAFTLVVCLLTVMLAFVNGMNRLTEASGQPNNVIVLSEQATDEVVSNLSPADIGELENQPGIARENGRPLASRETYLVINQPIPHARLTGPKRRFLQIRGLDDPLVAAQVHAMPLYAGGLWFSEAGIEQLPASAKDEGAGKRAIQAVLGEGVARELGRDRTEEELAHARNAQRLDVGDTFTLGERTWIVVGIMQSAGSTFNSEVWAKRSLVASLFGKDTYTSLVARTADAPSAQTLKTYLATQYKKASVQAQVESEYYASLADTNKQFLYAIVFVTVVMSIGGVFGVMNTMFAAISQRTADIGVLRLMGFARWQILVSFLLESLVIALVGGLLGCGLGWLSDGLTATSVVSSGPGGGKSVVLQLVVDANILALGILVTLLMGTLGGVVPALSAIRLRPLEALR